MTSQVLARLERQFKLKREQEAPPPTSGLGEAIERIIAEQVEARVQEALEKQRPYHNPAVPFHRREFTNKPDQHEFPPPPPQTKPPRDMTILLQRDGAGRARSVSIGETKFKIERDGKGRVVRMTQED